MDGTVQHNQVLFSTSTTQRRHLTIKCQRKKCNFYVSSIGLLRTHAHTSQQLLWLKRKQIQSQELQFLQRPLEAKSISITPKLRGCFDWQVCQHRQLCWHTCLKELFFTQEKKTVVFVPLLKCCRDLNHALRSVAVLSNAPVIEACASGVPVGSLTAGCYDNCLHSQQKQTSSRQWRQKQRPKSGP